MTADPLAAIRARHVVTFGKTMEPDPERPGYMRQVQWCPAHGDEVVLWPCDTAHALAALDALVAALADAERLAEACGVTLDFQPKSVSTEWPNEGRRVVQEHWRAVPRVGEGVAIDGWGLTVVSVLWSTDDPNVAVVRLR